MPTLTGIHNVNEFYSHHYLAEIFAGDIQATLERWREQAESASARTPWAELRALAPEHLRFRRDFERERRAGQRILRQREWFRLLLAALGYPCKPANLALEDGAEVPILCADGVSSGTPRLLALGAFDATGEGEDPLSLKPHALQFHGEAPPPEAVLNETWETIVTRRLFAQTNPPRWILILSCNSVLLLERGKWTHNRLLRFDFDDILSLREDATLKATAALLHRESLQPGSARGHPSHRESLLPASAETHARQPRAAGELPGDERAGRRGRCQTGWGAAAEQPTPLRAAGEKLGYDRWLTVNTCKTRQHSPFRQGVMLHVHLTNWPDDKGCDRPGTFEN